MFPFALDVEALVFRLEYVKFDGHSPLVGDDEALSPFKADVRGGEGKAEFPGGEFYIDEGDHGDGIDFEDVLFVDDVGDGRPELPEVL